MRRITLIFAGIVALLLALTLLALGWAFRPQPAQEGASVAHEDTLGDCSRSSWIAYSRIRKGLAPIGVGGSPVDFEPGALTNIRTAMDAQTFRDDVTYFVAANTATGTIYPVACAEKGCTGQEVAEPERQCLLARSGPCAYVAVVTDGVSYCVAIPRELN